VKGEPVYVLGGVRTPRGRAKDTGALHSLRPVDLLHQCYDALRARHGDAAWDVDDVVLGIVTAVGEQGANLAKISALYAGLPQRVPGATVNRFCASGLDAVAFAALKIAAGGDRAVLAGGVESMSRIGLFDDRGAWFSDPDVAKKTGFVHMGVAADLVASLAGLSKNDLDALAVQSHARAAAARASGLLQRSAFAVRRADGGVALERDELVREGLTLEKVCAMPAAFAADDLTAQRLREHTPPRGSPEPRHSFATSPAPADGASLLLLGDAAFARQNELAPRARIVATASAAVDPVVMLTGNVPATRLALERAGLAVGDVDLFEVNESFAAVPLHYAKELGVAHDRINVCGGAIALGHPLGATGGVLLLTLLDALDERGGRHGVVSICGGAGVATAIVVERISA